VVGVLALAKGLVCAAMNWRRGSFGSGSLAQHCLWYTVALSMIAGAALGGTAIQGLHAQAKLKAYSIGEIEVTDMSAQPAYLPVVRKAIEESHGRTLRTLNGRVVPVEGGTPPKNVAIVEWDSVDDALAFYKSKAWTDLAPQRDKSQKTIRRYVVEVEK
jgi:uncharacterized protein (DUF1330 family)